jgi:hypothetical protein
LGGVYVKALMEKDKWQRTARNKELVFTPLAAGYFFLILKGS